MPTITSEPQRPTSRVFLRLDGIVGLCFEDRYRGWLDIDCFSLTPPSPDGSEPTLYTFDFATAWHDGIPQLTKRYLDRAIIPKGELQVLCVRRSQLEPVLCARMERLRIASVQTVGDARSSEWRLRAQVRAVLERLELQILIPGMRDGWHDPAASHYRFLIWNSDDNQPA